MENLYDTLLTALYTIVFDNLLHIFDRIVGQKINGNGTIERYLVGVMGCRDGIVQSKVNVSTAESINMKPHISWPSIFNQI